jgi:hypothetical protein
MLENNPSLPSRNAWRLSFIGGVRKKNGHQKQYASTTLKQVRGALLYVIRTYGTSQAFDSIVMLGQVPDEYHLKITEATLLLEFISNLMRMIETNGQSVPFMYLTMGVCQLE